MIMNCTTWFAKPFRNFLHPKAQFCLSFIANIQVLALLFLMSLLPQTLSGQCITCPRIEAILVDACPVGGESENEFLVISTGSGFNTSNLQIDFDANNNIIGPENNDININATPCGLQMGNIGLVSGCTNVNAIGPGFDLPPNSLLIVQTSASANNVYDFSAMCGLGECVFVIQSACSRSAGAFTNSGSGIRTTTLSINGCACNQNFVYDRALLSGTHGDYVLDGPVYGNDGCDAPAVAGTIPPTFNNPGDQTVCGSYTLPAITGTNLTGNEAYYTGTNGTGTQYLPGQTINTTTTLYIYDNSVGCNPEPDFTVTVNTPTVPNLTNLPTLCDNGNPIVLNTTQDGFMGSWSGAGVSGNSFDPTVTGAGMHTITFTPDPGPCATSNTLDVTVEAAPGANSAGPLEACDEGGNQATFDLSSLDATIGGANTVLWFEDMALTISITPSNAFTSGSTTVYALVTTANCASSPEPVMLNVLPQLSTANISTSCSADNSTYTVTFDISGGAAPYTVTGGGTVTGNTFTSDPITSGATYNFSVTDASGCPQVDLSGSFECCTTSAGTMDLTPISLCTDQTANATHNGDQNLDGNDVLVFVLHNGTLNTIADVIAFNFGSPSFNFDGGSMTPGQTYFISAVAGNTDPPIVDLADLCLDISPGTPVTWTAPPELDNPGDQNVCQAYTLPPITGNNLSGNEAYYTGPNATGTQLAVGSDVTASMTIFIYDETLVNCSDEESFTVTIVPPPDVTPIADQTACDSYTLPVINGSNLTGAEAYYTGMNGTGTQFNAGQNITTSTTLFIYDGTSGCDDEESFNITITQSPDIDPIADQVACNSFTLPGITGTNLSGAEAYYTGPNGTGTSLSPGTNIITTTTLFIYDVVAGCDDEESFTINITPSPDINPIADQTACNAFTLPVITGTDLTGAEAYYTGPNGTGTQFNPGQNITVSTTLFIYDGTPGCDDQESFNITITPQPDINPLADQTVCNSFTLPPISGTNLTGAEAYYTGANGTGIQLNPGEVLNNSITLFIYDGAPGCQDEESFTITISPTPVLDPVADQTACGGFVLPVISGTNLTGAEAYYTGPNATGAQFLAGEVIGSSTTLFIYDGIPGCDDEVSFNITISPQPDVFPLADQFVCGSFTLPTINGTDLSGAEAYYTGANGTGVQLNPGEVINTTTSLFIYDGIPGCSDEESFTINVTTGPEIDPISDVQSCGSYTLEAINGNNLSGNQAYYTGPNGTGTQFLPGENINTSVSLFAYDGSPGCEDEEAFAITINAAPQLQQPADESVCGDFTLQAIQGTGLSGNEAYYTGPNGTGTQLNPGEVISSSTTLFIYDNNSGCEDEVSFTITVNDNPNIDPMADQEVCAFYVLPPISGTNLSGNEAYYTESGGLGTMLNPGEIIIASTTLFIYDGADGCADEETLSISIHIPPTLDLTQVTAIDCNGDESGSLNLEITGQEPFDIDWNVDELDGNATPQNLGAGIYYVVVTDANDCTAEANFELTEPDAIILSCAELNPVTTVGGNDGEATISLNGGTAPYTVDWSGPVSGNSTENNPGDFTIDNLEAGNYQIDITDANGCISSCNFTITDPNCSLALDISGTDITCNGDGDGTISLVINNGADPVDIDWNDDSLDGNDNPQNLEAGNYSVIVTDNNGCSATTSINIAEPDAIFLDCSVLSNTSGPGIDDGQVAIDFGGGTGSLTIIWTGAIDATQMEPSGNSIIVSDLPAGEYFLDITDENGCTTDCNFTISSADCTTSLDIEGQNLSCNGSEDGTISLTINDGPDDPVIDWNIDQYDGLEELSDLAAGDYMVTVSDGAGCEVTTSITITEPDAVLLDCAELTPVSAVGAGDGEATVTFSGGTGPYSIEWFGPENGGLMSDDPTTLTIDDLDAGSYQVFITDINECMTECNFVITDPNCTITTDIVSQDISCRGTNDGSIALNLSGGTEPLTIDWSDDAYDGMDELTGLAEGVYDVVITDDLGCEITASITLEAINELPEASITFGGITCAEDCYGFNINLNGDGPFILTYQIEIGGDIQLLTLNTNDNSNLLEFCPADLGVNSGAIGITFRGLEDANCTTEIDQTEVITVVAPSTENINPTLCDGESITVNGNVYDAANPQGMEVVPDAGPTGCDSVYTIDLSFYPIYETDLIQNLCNGESITVNNVVYDENNPSGTEVLTSSTGCDSTVNIDLTFFENEFITLDPVLCPGESIMVNNVVYDENNPSGQEILNTTNGCDSTITVALSFFEEALNDLEQTLCEGSSITVNGNVYDENNPSGQEILLGESVNGCDSIVNIDLAFSTAVSEDINLELCQGESITVNNVVYDENNPSGTEILPNGSTFGCDSIINVDLDFYIVEPTEITGEYCTSESFTVNNTVYDVNNPAGTEVITLPNGCDSIILIDLDFVDEVTHLINSTLCEGESIIVNDVVYDMNNPSGSETIPGGSALGCDSTILVDLTFEPTVIATLSGNVQICPGETVELTVNFSEPGTFSIRYSDGVNAVLLNNIQDGHIIEVSPTTSTSYFIDLVIIPNSNCPAIIEGEALVEVSNLGINAEVSDYGGFEISCNGSADGFIDINATGGLNPISYAWNTGATTSGLSNLGPGTYSVLVADAAGCSAETTATLTEPEAMILENTVINPSCFGDGDGSITLESIQGGTPPFEYSFDGEFFQSVTGIPFTLNNLFGGNYTLHIQDANDCKTELEVDIPNPPQLIVDLGEDVEIRLGDSTALDAFVNFDVAGLVWTPTDDLSDPQNLKTFASPYFTTEYRLEVSDENGCTVTDAITVFVDRFLIAFSPTAFSPNGDGINDYFTLFGDSSVELIEELLIFDRWGNKLFVATEIPVNEESLGWDGKFQGKPMNVGVYVYYAVLRFVDGRTQVFKGDITLVK